MQNRSLTRAIKRLSALDVGTDRTHKRFLVGTIHFLVTSEAVHTFCYPGSCNRCERGPRPLVNGGRP